jgi:hypothetical protein
VSSLLDCVVRTEDDPGNDAIDAVTSSNMGPRGTALRYTHAHTFKA